MYVAVWRGGDAVCIVGLNHGLVLCAIGGGAGRGAGNAGRRAAAVCSASTEGAGGGFGSSAPASVCPSVRVCF